jgi:16S rRNA (guanine966-N2)-methyltransferase
MFVEADRRAGQVLRGNVAELALGGSVRIGPVDAVLAQPADQPFDLVLADPPYAVDAARLRVMLTALAAGGWLAEGGLVVLERAQRAGEPDWPAGFAPLRVMRHGDTALHWAEYVTSPGRPG